MNIDSFTDEQMLNLVNNTITSKTEFNPLEFTGGATIITTTHNNTVKKYRVSLYFGYKGKHSVNRQIEISKDLYFIWCKAILVKIMSLDADSIGMNINELNNLMKSNSNSNLSNSSIVDSKCLGDTPVPTPVPVIISDSEHIAIKVSNYLLKKISSYQPSFVKKGNWIKDIDLAIQIDKRTEQQLIACIDWIYTDGDFWIPNVQSGKKLREKFNTMEAQMMSSSRKDHLNGLSEIVGAYNAS